MRYWYRQMDIQLDSILSTTVSDLGVQTGLVPRGPAVPAGRPALQAPDPPPASMPRSSLREPLPGPFEGGMSLRPRG